MDDDDKIPSFTQRKKLMGPKLSALLGKNVFTSTKSASTSSSSFQRRDLGELTHIFSHVKHHMGIEHLHFAAKPSLLKAINNDNADDNDDDDDGAKARLRWMNAAEMHQLGITTGVRKILSLVAKAPVNTIVASPQTDVKVVAAASKKSRSGVTRSHVAERASVSTTKRMKTLTSFFKK